MLNNRFLNVSFLSIILFAYLLHPHHSVFAQSSAHYPLQTQYPEIMLYKADIAQKKIALTFDDGPDHRFTPPILDVLAKHKVKATFFLLGTRVTNYPDVVKRIHDEGHVIGNHTYWHPELTKTGVKNLVWELEKNEKAIESIINFKTKLFRAPYGALDKRLVEKLGEMDYRGIGWSIDTEDWKKISAQEIKQKIVTEIHPGAIILMHSAGHWTQDLSGTVQAIDELIPYLRKKGYEFVTVPELWSLSR